MIAIVDYGMGNLLSVANMLRKIGGDAKITSDPGIISSSEGVILPGVGHFGKAMERIKNSGLDEVLQKKVIEDKAPLLGICLGMQLLMEKSEEGNSEGLGWIPGEVVKFNTEEAAIKIPHMGWDRVQPRASSHLFDNLSEARFYFVHSYYVKCRNDENVLGTTDYGTTFTSSVIKDNIAGVQFHPEKSHKFGMQLLINFLKIVGN